MSKSSSVPSAQDYLERARMYYHDQNAEKARNYFEKACLSCPCHKKDRLARREYVIQCQAKGLNPEPTHYVRDYGCSCKDIMHELTRGLHGLNKRSVSQLAARPCVCKSKSDSARGLRPCHDDLHIGAIDGISACYELMGDFEASFDAALIMIHKAPMRPEGYLRAAKLTTKIKPDRYRTSELHISAAEYQLLKRLLSSHSRADPVARLPGELLIMIMSHFQLKDKLACQRVSRSWSDFVSSPAASSLWQHLDFDSQFKPSIAALGRVFRLSNSIRDGKIAPTTKHVKIRDWNNFSLDKNKLAMITRLPYLEVLEVRQGPIQRPKIGYGGPAGNGIVYDPPPFPDAATMKHLKRLVLESFEPESRKNSAPFRNIWAVLANVAPCLETIEFCGYNRPLFVKPFPKVKVLKLSMKPGGKPPNIRFAQFNETFPNLEQLYLDVAVVHCTAVDPGALPKLKTLVIGCLIPGFADTDDPVVGRRIFPSLPPTLRVLDLGMSSYSLVKEILFHYPEPLERPTLSHLEVFRLLDNDYDADAVLEVLKPSMESGSLRVMDVALPRSPAGALVDRLGYEAAIAATVDQFAGPDLPLSSLTTVGIPRYVTRNMRSYHSTHTTRPFVDWVAKFPNVDTVRFYPEAIENAAEAIVGLVKLPGVKTIYQNCLKGVLRDEVLTLAGEAGVRIVDTPDAWFPAQFPYVFADGDGSSAGN
ncbi:hypothetical protein MCOR13_007046 [Pyricularia oryzae]|nr:hypothetical protein MCOR13_007046 [Pyricularia oryzae]